MDGVNRIIRDACIFFLVWRDACICGVKLSIYKTHNSFYKSGGKSLAQVNKEYDKLISLLK